MICISIIYLIMMYVEYISEYIISVSMIYVIVYISSMIYILSMNKESEL